MVQQTVTEWTFYPALMQIIQEAGGTSVQESRYETRPDILFELHNRRWILSIKIGESLSTLKQSFVQFTRHKNESLIPRGIILFLPESVRDVAPTEQAVLKAMRTVKPSAIIDAETVKAELSDRTFPEVLQYLTSRILPSVEKKESLHYPLDLVIRLLQVHVQDIMKGINLNEASLLQIVTDKKLLMDLGHLKQDEIADVARFLGAYILLSQILFLRLLITASPDKFTAPSAPVDHRGLRLAFQRVLEVNYRPIYELDVLDSVSDEFLKDTYDLLWGLEIEKSRYELPGRIFHELMPAQIRKLMAAFYTRPQAAEILAALTISQSTNTVFDPACGSGTILVSAYRRKLKLWRSEGKGGNPHKRFCEQEMFGADIMPFAVHLASANLSAIDAGTTIGRTQIIRADSLRLCPDQNYNLGLQLLLFPSQAAAKTAQGDDYVVPLVQTDVTLMNPPFTKTERGIKQFVDMERFESRVGGEVGLWGHFIALADMFLKTDGIYGGVIPINVIRGRESGKVRDLFFKKWTPLFILKPTLNYGFSEWSEYRDILLIARKAKPSANHKVKFCLVKKDLTQLTPDDIDNIVATVTRESHLRDHHLVDVDSHTLKEIRTRFDNMMWFCGVTNFTHRDKLLGFHESASSKLLPIPKHYCRTGCRTEGGQADLLFLTRAIVPARTEKAFLSFRADSKVAIKATSSRQVSYLIEKTALIPSLRTPVGIKTMDLAHKWDYVATHPYKEINSVSAATGVRVPNSDFWRDYRASAEQIGAHLVISNRLNPFSPDQSLIAFYSSALVCPADQLNVAIEPDKRKAKALCTVMNSILFFSQFFLLKEESTGRYIHIRIYDLEQMSLVPAEESVAELNKVYERFKRIEFPSIGQQFDQNFSERYDESRSAQRSETQPRLFSVLDKPGKPFPQRLAFDKAVCKAVGVKVSDDQLRDLYGIIVKEMILTRGLKRD